MDMNTNRYEKPVHTPSRGAEGASPDCVTVEQCQSAYRQSMKATVSEFKKTETTAGILGFSRGSEERKN